MRYKLSDVIDLIGGGTPKTSIAEYWGGDIPWLSVKDFNGDSRYVYSTEKTITETGLANSSTKLLDVDDIIISARGTVGELAMIPLPMAFNQSCYGIRGKKGKVVQTYLYYLLKYSIRLLKSQTHGSVFDTITKDTFTNIDVDLPPLEEQQAIAATLSARDDKLANNRAINNHLEQMAQAIFKSWFVDFEPWRGKQPASWNIGTISDISSDIICGKTPPTKVSEYFGDDIPFITIPDMHGVVYITSTERSLSVMGAESQSGKTVPPNSVCVSCIATAGLVALTSTPSQTNQQINTIVCKSGISSHFVYLSMVGMADRIKMLGSGGSATNNLNKGQFSKIELVIPDGNDMREFATLVEPLFEAIKANQQENAFLAKTRDALLPRLMSGELEAII
jgi:type I restriction enzyme S subunit